ncbi:cold-shock protein [Nocardia xishanensis]|uniref:cold-shock protein n=1 Tax=Nocardia xishanensis TaxID=238964 RepID=UPI00082FE506|nr:cold-shock protein [Nocardia xishanensis]
METGTVRWFDEAKGFGFIASDTGGGDVFVHHSEIQAEGWRSLQPEQRVQFVRGEGRKGPAAQQVVPL